MSDANHELWVICDLRGLIIHSYNSGTDPDSNSENKTIRSPGFTLDKFITRYLKPISEIVPLNRIICVNDAGKEFRRAIDPNYKTRPEMEPELRESTQASQAAVRELLHSLGILQCSVEGTEADDIIAYLNGKLPGRKLIYTVDGDIVALASSTTKVFLKGQVADVYRFKNQSITIDIQPRHVTLFKSIVGDSSDTIKGVPGMGPMMWLGMVEAFGLDGLDQLSAIAESGDFGALKTIAEQEKHPLLLKLYNGLEMWSQSWLLAKLNPGLVDMRFGKTFRRICWDKRLPSRERLRRLAMNTAAYWLEEELNHLLPNQTLVLKEDWDDTVLAEAADLFSKSRFISIDWESASVEHKPFIIASEGMYVDMLGSEIVSMGLTCGENLEHTFYFSFGHLDPDGTKNIDKSHLVELLELIPEGMPIIAQNALFEVTLFANEFGFIIPNLHDTKIMASHVDETTPSGLKDLSKRYLNYDQIRYNDVIEKGKTMWDYPPEHVFAYGADDPLVTGHLYDLFKTILYIEGTWEFVRRNEFPVNYVFSDSYLAGVSIDYDEVARQHEEDQETYDLNMEQIRVLLRTNVNDTTIYEGAKNWVEELLVNHAAEANYLTELVTKTHKKFGDGFVKVLQADKVVMKWVPNAVTEGSNAKDIILAIEEQLQRDSIVGATKTGERAKLWKQAVEAATYTDLVVKKKPAAFQWSLGHVNKLAEDLELPNWPCINDLEVMAAHALNLEDVDVDQQHYIDMVIGCATAAATKKHAKCAAYQWLKKEYVDTMPCSITKEGSELNMGSPKQMTELMYAILGLPIRTRNPVPSETRELRGLEGAPQADKDAVAMAIAVGDATGWKKEVLDLFTEAKSAATRISLFYNKLPMWKHPVDGLIHPQFNSTGTETRRPTGNSPNLLQLSKRGEGVKVRKCFIPNQKLGHDVIISLDWDGEELRIIAGLSGDKAMTSCYIGDDKKNVHSLTGAGIAGVSYEEFTKIYKDEDHALHAKFDTLRKDSKNVNFLSTYGGGAAKLARKLLCPVETAAEYLKAKKATYFGIEDWRKEEITKLHANGYITTLFGTRKHVYNNLCGSDEGLVAYYERSAINQEIQGVAADYLKKVLADMWEAGTLSRHGAVLYAAIYDELVFSAHSSQAVSLIKEVYSIMIQGIPGLPIPMLANPAIGVNFADQVEILADADDELTDEKIILAMNKAFEKAKVAAPVFIHEAEYSFNDEYNQQKEIA